MPVKIPAAAGKPYRPSNGTEGEMFMERFCADCTRYDGCDILDRAFMFDLTDEEYPTEWVYDEHGSPQCTAQTFKADRPPPRCKSTIEMNFGDGDVKDATDVKAASDVEGKSPP